MQRVLKYDVFVTYSSKIKPILQEVESCDLCMQSNFDFLLSAQMEISKRLSQLWDGSQKIFLGGPNRDGARKFFQGLAFNIRNMKFF